MSGIKYKPKSKFALEMLLENLITDRGYDADLNDIDTNLITDMSELFSYSDFNGNISE